MSLLPFPRWLRNAFQCAALLLGLVAVLAAAEPGPASSGLAARVVHAREEKKNDARLSALGEIARSLSLAEIPEALRLAHGLTSLRERMALGDMALRRWGELAPAAAFAHVAAMPESYSKIEAIRSVAVSFAKADGPAAAAAALHMNPGRSRLEAIQLVGEIWASVDLPAALQWARTLPEGAGKEEVWRRIHFVWVHADPVAAAPSIREFPAGEYRNALLMNVAANWAAIDPDAALRWTQALPAGEEQDTMQVMAVESWANADPLAACQFAQKLPPNLRPRAVLAALDRWATQDPHEALQWVSRQGDRFLSERGIAQILSTCASVCPEDAAHWVEQLPLGPVRDNAIGAYVDTVQAWDPATATRLAALTADAVARQQRVGLCFQQWRALDPEGAERWLTGADFPEETKRDWRAERTASAP